MLTNQELDKFLETLKYKYMFILNEQSFTFKVMSFVVINGRYILRRKKKLVKNCCEEMQVGKKKFKPPWGVGLLGERSMHVFSIYATEKYSNKKYVQISPCMK